jgi:hypothetical protein
MPKRGADLVTTTTTSAMVQPVRTLSGFDLAQALVDLGVKMSRETNATIAELYGDAGVPEDQLDALKARLSVRAGLRVVAGGGA